MNHEEKIKELSIEIVKDNNGKPMLDVTVKYETLGEDVINRITMRDFDEISIKLHLDDVARDIELRNSRDIQNLYFDDFNKYIKRRKNIFGISLYDKILPVVRQKIRFYYNKKDMNKKLYRLQLALDELGVSDIAIEVPYENYTEINDYMNTETSLLGGIEYKLMSEEESLKRGYKTIKKGETTIHYKLKGTTPNEKSVL